MFWINQIIDNENEILLIDNSFENFGIEINTKGELQRSDKYMWFTMKPIDDVFVQRWGLVKLSSSDLDYFILGRASKKLDQSGLKVYQQFHDLVSKATEVDSTVLRVELMGLWENS